MGIGKSIILNNVSLLCWKSGKKALDGKGKAGAILTDLSKAFGCLNHNLLLAKMDAYGFDKSALTIYTRLPKQKKTKNKSKWIVWLDLIYGVPQGSILGPLLFNIFINDMFYFIKETKIANYADDNTVYTVDKNIQNLLQTLENETNLILDWFRKNEMKPNDDKCHLIVCNQEKLSVTLGNESIDSTDTVELLGITIDKNLNFTEHVSDLCKRGNQKLHVLARNLEIPKRRQINTYYENFH